MGEKTNLTVIFDFDGTLANTLDLVMRIYNDHAESLGVKKVAPEEYDELREMGYKKAMKAKNVHWWVVPKLILTVRKEMHEHMGEVQPYEGIVGMLADLRAKDVSIGILTSNDGALVQNFLEAHSFPVFDFLVSEKTIFGKEKALKKIMDRHSLSKENVIYVGDEPRDVSASKKAGVKVVGVTWGFGGESSLQKTPPDILVHTVAELKKALLAEVSAR